MSGGGGFSGYSPVDIISKITSSTNSSASSQREIDINKLLEELLMEFNNRDVEAIRRHLEVIEKALGREIEGIEKILFGGSISKSTFIEGTSDVDALVFLDSDIYKNLNPKELQDAFYTILKQRFPRTDIQKGCLAVTLKFSDYEVQLLPALRKNGKIRIADTSGTGWSKPINLSAFTSQLTKINKANANKVVPVIKLVKKMLEKVPKKYQLSGYYIEALAVDAFSAYNGRYTLYDMTKHLLDQSVKRVLQPMQDVTGQSGIIDDDWGSAYSLTRQRVSSWLKDIAGRFSNADVASIENELF